MKTVNKKCKLDNKIPSAAFSPNFSGPAHPMIGNGKLKNYCNYNAKYYNKLKAKFSEVLERDVTCLGNRVNQIIQCFNENNGPVNQELIIVIVLVVIGNLMVIAIVVYICCRYNKKTEEAI